MVFASYIPECCPRPATDFPNCVDCASTTAATSSAASIVQKHCNDSPGLNRMRFVNRSPCKDIDLFGNFPRFSARINPINVNPKQGQWPLFFHQRKFSMNWQTQDFLIINDAAVCICVNLPMGTKEWMWQKFPAWYPFVLRNLSPEDVFSSKNIQSKGTV